jgi:hypothetical protein
LTRYNIIMDLSIEKERRKRKKERKHLEYA